MNQTCARIRHTPNITWTMHLHTRTDIFRRASIHKVETAAALASQVSQKDYLGNTLEMTEADTS